VETLATFQGKGYQIIIVTNQYLIGEGLITRNQYDPFSARMLKVLAGHGKPILDTFRCPHRRDHDCACMKLKPGLVQAALTKYPDIDLHHRVLAGDSPGDVKLAEEIGRQAFSLGVESGRRSVTTVASLRQVTASI
jgi:D-glycero-D-manno-heptose 1,7-bisphosphate phosphatase